MMYHLQGGNLLQMQPSSDGYVVVWKNEEGIQFERWVACLDEARKLYGKYQAKVFY